MSIRVVYGETMPAWEKTFPTMLEAEAFAQKQRGVGDRIFSIKAVVAGEPPQSLTGAITASKVFEFTASDGGKYQVNSETGEVCTWIERRQKASGWQRLKSAPRIKRILKEARPFAPR